MAEDAHSRFIDGQRVAALHLQHLQDRLRESVADLRRGIGLDTIVWGLRAELDGQRVTVQPGAAFAASGVRLFLDETAQIELPAGGAPWRVVLRARNADIEELRHHDAPTLITLTTVLAVTSAADPGDADSITVAQVEAGDGGMTLRQEPSQFAASGHHSHSGEWLQDGQGRWHFDGPALAGPPGPAGDRGPRGQQGVSGEAGLQGPAGGAGEPGESGPRGSRGAKGEPGTDGPVGSPGDAGPAGPRGPRGAPGGAGADGTPGPQGEAGPPGSRGARGAKGDLGTAGAAGVQGQPGPAGPRGPRGLRGLRGLQGARGVPGPAGAGLDPDWPALARINWKHGVTLDPRTAARVTRSLQIVLSSPISDRSRQQSPQIVQVLFEPGVNPQRRRALIPMATIPGAAKLAASAILWRLGVDDGLLAEEMSVAGGRVWIRVHCGALTDTRDRPYSASTNILHGVEAPRAPGGVFESWYFVRR